MRGKIQLFCNKLKHAQEKHKQGKSTQKGPTQELNQYHDTTNKYCRCHQLGSFYYADESQQTDYKPICLEELCAIRWNYDSLSAPTALNGKQSGVTEREQHGSFSLWSRINGTHVESHWGDARNIGALQRQQWAALNGGILKIVPIFSLWVNRLSDDACSFRNYRERRKVKHLCAAAAWRQKKAEKKTLKRRHPCSSI